MRGHVSLTFVFLTMRSPPSLFPVPLRLLTGMFASHLESALKGVTAAVLPFQRVVLVLLLASAQAILPCEASRVFPAPGHRSLLQQGECRHHVESERFLGLPQAAPPAACEHLSCEGSSRAARALLGGPKRPLLACCRLPGQPESDLNRDAALGPPAVHRPLCAAARQPAFPWRRQSFR